MTPTAASKLFLTLACLLAGSNAFTITTSYQHVATPMAIQRSETALDMFARSSPSKDSVSFLRGDRPSNKRRHRGHTDTSSEGDPPAPSGIEHKSGEEELKTPAKKKGYQRAEEWDAEQKEGGLLSWDQKVQFDGLRMGNQVRQNDILMRNLRSF